MKSSWFLVLLPAATWAADVGYNWKCNLYCYHGGECHHGKTKFGSYTDVEEDTTGLPWENANTHGAAGMYCSCPAGYTGLQCEIAMKVCGENEHTCFNGSACAKETDMDGKTWWRCECDVENSVLTDRYAQKYCDHISTTFCNKNSNNLGSGNSYCKNGGQCKPKDHQGQNHAGCICQEGFEGSHCEIVTITKKKTMSEYAAEASNSKMLGLIVGIVVAVVLAGTAFLYIRDKKARDSARKRRRLRNAGIETSESFRRTNNGELA